MPAELVIPEVGESIAEVEIGEWLKHEGDRVDKDEVVARIETDKASVEVVAPTAGVLQRIVKGEGESAKVGEVIGYVAEVSETADEERPAKRPRKSARSRKVARSRPPEREAEPSDAAEPEEDEVEEREEEPDEEEAVELEPRIMPSARRALDEHGLSPRDVPGTGPGGRILKEDVERHLRERSPPEEPPTEAAPRDDGVERVVPMSPIRRRIAERLVEAQRTAALLSTFNEVDMTAVQALRREHAESFRDLHGVKLGIMPFFVRAVVEALRRIPELGAEIRDGTLVYRKSLDIGIAVGGGKGLVVPVLREADRMSFAGIEKAVDDFVARARGGTLQLAELQGGVFTITNGGVFGSLLSTPIVNPPQSGILGLHAIQPRPVARRGRVRIRPMMYVALTYDHRIVDGREAVRFLVRIKECVENPSRILLDV